MKYKKLIIILAISLLSINTHAQFSIQKGLIEVFTGTWSQYAPDAFVRLDSLLAHLPNACAVNIHNGDAMEITEGNDIDIFYGASGYPMAVVNREGDRISRNTWETYTSNLLSASSAVTISFDSVRFDTLSRQLDVYLKAVFTGPETGDLRFNCILTEDSVTGTGSGYNQVNGLNTTPGHPYYQAGNPIIGLPHRWVARDYLGGPWGSSGIIPASVSFGNTFYHHYQVYIPVNVLERRVSLVGMVSSFDGSALDERKILNVEKCPGILPPVALFSASDSSICSGDSIQFSNLSYRNPESFLWEFEGGIPASSNLKNPPMVKFLQSGNHTVTLTVKSPAGTSVLTLGILVDSLNLQVVRTDSSLLAVQTGALYQWLDCSAFYQPVAGETNREFVIPANGLYALAITRGSCTDTTGCILVDDFSIRQSSSAGAFLGPNPSHGNFILSVPGQGNAVIYNLHGTQITEFKVYEGDNPIQTGLPPGLYFLEIRCQNLSKILKFNIY